MPERPPDPTLPNFLTDILQRLRAVERQTHSLPDGADPLQTFESGSPLGDTFSLNFGDNLYAVLDGANQVTVHGTGGGPGGWDAIVDGTIGSSDPENRLFLGIGEALTYLRTTLGYLYRAMILVRSNPTSLVISDMPAGETYVETAHVTAPAYPVIVSSQWFLGGHPFSGQGLPRWDHDGYDMTASTWTVFGMHICGKEQSAFNVGEQKTALFQGGAVLYDCFLEPSHMGQSGGASSTATSISSANSAWLIRCWMPNGWMRFAHAFNCRFRVYTPGTYSPFDGVGFNTPGLMLDCHLDTSTLLGGACTWTFPSGHTQIRLRGQSDASQQIISFNYNAGGVHKLKTEYLYWVDVTSSSNSTLELEGDLRNITLGAPDFANLRSHRVFANSWAGGSVDVTGPAEVFIGTVGTTTVRGESVSGVINTRHGSSSGQAVNFVNADQANLVIAGTPRLASTGTHKPYAFDASSINNVIVLSGRSLYANAGTDAGTNNRVLPEGSPPPSGGIAPADANYLVGTAHTDLSSEIVVGTTPGGELGGTWASPTVDTTHSGSAHADFIAKAFLDTKGDIISATANDTPVIVPVGTDGDVLTADSGAAAGVSWQPPSGGPGGAPSFGNVTGPASYATGGFVLDLSGTYATTLDALMLQLEVEDADLPPHQLVVTRDSPSAGQATIKVMRIRYDKATAVGNVSGQPGGVTVQGSSGATTATEAAHTHSVDLPNFTGNSGANQSTGINPVSGVGGQAADDAAHTHTIDHDHAAATSAAGSAHAHVDDNIYEHQHGLTNTTTDAVYVELSAGTNISSAVWRYMAMGS